MEVWPRAILHVDMDAFFASVEIRDDPSLRGRPVLVGGAGRRGVVAAASYEARKFGCHSAQPMALALRRCPKAVVMPPRFSAYEAASNLAFSVFSRFSPAVEPLSIDEAFIDLTGTERLLGSPGEAAVALREAVRRETGGLTCSVGISAVKFVAKIASEMDKPDGLTAVLPGSEREFLKPLAIRKLWGIGPKTEARLHGFGIKTVGDLGRLDREVLRGWFGEHGSHLWALSRALDPRAVEPQRERKQISHEDTYAADAIGVTAVRRKLLSQATRVADRMVAKGLRARRIQLKIRDTAFKTETRQSTVSPTSDAKVIYDEVCQLLATVELEHRRFRLTGVAVSELEPSEPAEQLSLLNEPSGAQTGERLQSVVSEVRRRFGHQALYPAAAGSDERSGSAGALSKTKPRGE